MIVVLAFARYRTLLGFRRLELAMPEPMNVLELLADPCFSNLPKEALVAVNQTFVKRSAKLMDGDEVALMPPVSGG